VSIQFVDQINVAGLYHKISSCRSKSLVIVWYQRAIAEAGSGCGGEKIFNG
jgi:hypothetical protein